MNFRVDSNPLNLLMKRKVIRSPVGSSFMGAGDGLADTEGLFLMLLVDDFSLTYLSMDFCNSIIEFITCFSRILNLRIYKYFIFSKGCNVSFSLMIKSCIGINITKKISWKKKIVIRRLRNREKMWWAWPMVFLASVSFFAVAFFRFFSYTNFATVSSMVLVTLTTTMVGNNLINFWPFLGEKN